MIYLPHEALVQSRLQTAQIPRADLPVIFCTCIVLLSASGATSTTATVSSNHHDALSLYAAY